MNQAPENIQDIKYNFPSEANSYVGEFVVYFPNEEKPSVLYHSLDTRQVYKEAARLAREKGEIPAVVRITNKEGVLARNLLARA